MKFPLLALPVFVCGLAAILHCFPVKGLSLSAIPDRGSAVQKVCFTIPGIDPLHPGRPQAEGDADIVHRSSPPASAKLPSMKISEVHALISAAAQQYRIPEAFLKSIVAAESNFDSGAVSSKGAIGLMQLMPETAHEFGAADPAIPEQNVDAGTRYLRCLIEKYRRSRNPLAHVIAAYNAGPAAVDRYRGVPPFRETKGYVVRVLAFFQRFQKEHRQSGLRALRLGTVKSNLLPGTIFTDFGKGYAKQ